MDEFDNLLTECILKPSREILGIKIAGKKKIEHEELTSPALRILEAALAIGTDNRRLSYSLTYPRNEKLYKN